MLIRVRHGLAGAVILAGLAVGGTAKAQRVIPIDPTALRHSFTVEPYQPDIAPAGRIDSVTLHPRDGALAIVASDSGGLFATFDHGRHWSHLDAFPTNHTRNVRYLPNAPDKVVATAEMDWQTVNGGGIYLSPDGGQTWRKPPVTMPPNCGNLLEARGIDISPDGNRIYIATTCGVAVSANQGETWNIQEIRSAFEPFADPERDFYAVAVLGGRRVVLGGGSGIWYSTDDGATWERAAPGPSAVKGINALARNPLTTSEAYAVADDTRLWTSSTGGRTWLSRPTAPPGNGACGGIGFARAEPASDGLTLYYGNHCLVYRLTARQQPSTGAYDYNGSWEQLNVSHSDPRDIALGPIGTPSFIATDGGLHASADGGASYPLIGGGQNGLNALQVYEIVGQFTGFFGDTLQLYFGTQDNQLWASPDGGHTWPVGVGSEGSYFGLPRQGPRSGGRVSHHDFGGRGSTWIGDPLFQHVVPWTDPADVAGAPVFIRPGTYVQQAQAGNGPWHLLLTTDEGVSWRQIAEVPNEHGFFGLPKVSGNSADPVLYQPVKWRIPTDGREVVRLARVSDFSTGPGNVTYPAMRGFGGLGVTGTEFSWFEAVAVDPHNPRNLVAYDVINPGLKFSTNSGDDWGIAAETTDLITHGGRLMPNIERFALVSTAAFCPDSTSRVLAGSSMGDLYFSNDSGHNWTVISESTSIATVTSIFWSKRTCDEAIISTYGRGLWRLRLRASLGDFAVTEPCALWGGVDCFIRIDQGKLSERSGIRHFDQGFVVLGGQITDLDYRGDIIKSVSVSPGSILVSLTDGSLDALPLINERPKSGQFWGIEGLAKLAAAGTIVQGIGFSQGKPVQLVVGDGVLEAKVADMPASGAGGTGLPIVSDGAYITLASGSYDAGVSTATAGEPILVQGARFKVADGSALELRVDSHSIGQIEPNPDGTFGAEIDTTDLAKGEHKAAVVQVSGGKTTVVDASTFHIVHREDEERDDTAASPCPGRELRTEPREQEGCQR